MCWNVNGLSTKLTDPDFLHFVSSFDICCLTETFTFPGFDFSVCFDNYVVLHSPAVKLSQHGRCSGGTVLMFKKSLQGFISEIQTGFPNILCLKISKELINKPNNLFCIGMYNHPSNSVYYKGKDFLSCFELLEQFMLSILESYGDCHFMIGGDLNARIGDWSFETEVFDFVTDKDVYSRKTQDSVTNGFGKMLIELCTMFELTPLNGLCKGDIDGSFTYHSDRGNSLIDYIMCSIDVFDIVDTFSVTPRVETDHMAVCARLFGCVDSFLNYDQENVSFDKVFWDLDKLHMFLDYFNCEEAKVNLENASRVVDSDVEAAVSKFTETMCNATSCMKRTVRIGRRSRTTNKWFDEECRVLKREAKQMLNRYARSRTLENKQRYKEKRTHYQKVLKEKKKEYKKTIQDSLLNHRKDSKHFWSTINRTRKRQTDKPKIDINVLKQHFENILAKQIEDKESTDWDLEDDIVVEDLDKDITEQEVQWALRRLKGGKAGGLDEVIAESLKAAEPFIVPFLTKLFNRLFQTGYFPTDWSCSVIIPLFKKGNVSNPENYRGISLLSVISKLFTAILNKRLYNWAEQEQKINEEQAGFRKEYSTIDHVFSLISMIKACLGGRGKGKLYVAFIDYKRAFDSVDRNSLWKVLQKIKTSTKMIRVLQGMYSSVQACVRWGQSVSTFFDCPAGLKQGCLLSPLIFSLLISEVGDAVSSHGRDGFQFLPGLKEIFLLLFADDIALISTTPFGLQNQINSLEYASKNFGLTVNLDKTKVMVFRKGGHLSKHEKWYYNGQQIENVNSYKYLGYTLTTKLSEDIALREFVGRAKAKVVQIMKSLWSLGSMQLEVFFKLFDAQVRPSLLYAAEVWGVRRFDCMESAHLFACKKFLGVSIKTPNLMVYGETGRFPLYIYSTLCAIRYWFKLQRMDISRIPKQAYEMQKKKMFDANQESNWALQVKDCFDKFGFSHVWLDGGVAHEKVFLSELRQRMIDCYKQQWSAKLRDSDRFKFYRSFKSLLEPEQYLTNINISKFRSALVRLRLGINELEVNKRYGNVAKPCPFCNVNESEHHFVYECKGYTTIRTKYLVKYYKYGTVEPSLNFFMQNNEITVNRDVALYISKYYYALRHRENP